MASVMAWVSSRFCWSVRPAYHWMVMFGMGPPAWIGCGELSHARGGGATTLDPPGGPPLALWGPRTPPKGGPHANPRDDRLREPEGRARGKDRRQDHPPHRGGRQ